MNRLKPIQNAVERAVGAELQACAAAEGLKVWASIRLGDVLDLDRSGLTRTEFDFATRSHLDFVVGDAATSIPAFAVEVDSSFHDGLKQRRLDAMKDGICHRFGLDLLRVDQGCLGTVGSESVIALLLRQWSFNRAFDQAQERGQVPWNEDFIPSCVYDVDDDGRLTPAFAPDMRVRARLFHLAGQGQLADGLVESMFRDDVDGWAEAHAWVRAAEDRYLLSHARCRSFRSPVGMPPSELAETIAVCRLEDDVRRWFAGEPVAVGGGEIEALRRRTNVESGWHPFGYAAGSEASDVGR